MVLNTDGSDLPKHNMVQKSAEATQFSQTIENTTETYNGDTVYQYTAENKHPNSTEIRTDSC